MGNGYNLNFKLFLEGIEVPFKSANISTTPNGTVASINVLSNKEALEITPKTQAQLFFKDWIYDQEEDIGWRLMFDGYVSKPYKIDQSTQGRTLTLECRDFRADIRKLPAATAYDTTNFGVNYNIMGIYRSTVTKTGKKPTESYGNTAISTMAAMLRRIAGSARGVSPGAATGSRFSREEIQDLFNDVDSGNSDDGSRGFNGFLLDSLARGIWNESVNGTVQTQFFNKRIRADKKMVVPYNESGTRFWSAQTAGLEVSRALMGGAKFTSIEALTLRVAGIFSARPYSCSTPSLISLKEKENDQDNPILDYLVHPDVRKNLIEDESFGAQYTLNECMILPPFEFTSPPNCNIWFQSMYDRVEINFDIDADITRGIFQQQDTFDNETSTELAHKVYSVPAEITDKMDTKGEEGRKKLKMTTEERYKGVNIHQSTVEYDLGVRDKGTVFRDTQFGEKLYKKSKQRYQKLEKKRSSSKSNELKDSPLNNISQKIDKAKKQIEKVKSAGTSNDKSFAYALRRHSLIKYINVKFSNRVATCTGNFNPYQTPGFPGMIIASPNSGMSSKSGKTIIGTVQQVKHIISISTQGAEASTTTVLNNARYIDEPTDINLDGLYLYETDTDPFKAKINKETFYYDMEPYFVPAGKPRGRIISNDDNLNNKYDLKITNENEDYKYAKDFLTLSREQYADGARNLTYIDKQYEPNRISKFYKYFFQESHDHFMIGTFNTNDEKLYYMYDTIHEATEKQLETHPANDDYETAMKFVKRNIVSADEFYKLILQATTKDIEEQDNGKIKKVFKNDEESVDKSRIDSEYYGVTNEKFEEVKEDLRDAENDLMVEPGYCSSINEHVPVTSLIKERKESVKKYLNSIKEFGDAIN